MTSPTVDPVDPPPSTAGIAAATTIAVVVVTLVRAFVVAHLWRWFVADTFGAPALSVAETAGLILIVQFYADLLPAARGDDPPLTYRYITTRVIARIINAAVALAFGLALVHFR